jgi:hypothetical protein
MNRVQPEIEYVRAYSIALLCLGLFSLLAALQYGFELRSSEDSSSLILVSGILCLLGSSSLMVSLLRWVRAAAALPATAALSYCLLFVFPFGTALSIYWLTSVRPKETIPQDVSQRTWFNYTVALYILGLLLLDTALVFRYVFVLGSPETEDQWPNVIGLLLLVLASVAIATGGLRSSRLRRAHWATFIFNVLLVVWFPIGTAFALGWFFGVRKHEKKLLSEE